MKLDFPKGMKSMLQNPNLEIPANFVDEPINYLGRAYGNAYDFRQVKIDNWEVDWLAVLGQVGNGEFIKVRSYVNIVSIHSQ